MRPVRASGEPAARRVRVPGAVAVVVVALASLVLSGACDDAAAPPPAPGARVDQEEADRTVAGLCGMLEAGRRQRDTVSALFYDESHASLHRIAGQAETEDRSATALLLQRKQVVEEILLSDPLPRRFVGDVQALVAATDEALTAIGLRPPGCDAG